MTSLRKIVVYSLSGLSRDIFELTRQFMAEGVKFVVVVGRDASELEEVIDRVCIGDGTDPYEMLTASLEACEGVAEAINLANSMSDEYGHSVHVVEF